MSDLLLPRRQKAASNKQPHRVGTLDRLKPDPPGYRERIKTELFLQDVVDFGCGYGRYSEIVPTHRYVGVDIDQAALDGARRAYPGYRFELPDAVDVGAGDVLFAHEVFRHMKAADVKETLMKFRQPRVLVSESFAAVALKWYNKAFGEAGYKFARCVNDGQLYLMEFNRK